jgi:glycosyltransferase involved in cell wall biosynthesis
MTRPLVSVVMSVWNEEKYLADSIGSILAQTYTDYDFVIVNDGSTDKTQEILETFAQKDSRIRLVINEVNMGTAVSLNRGIESARGKYIARMDSGDICQPARLEKQVGYLKMKKNVSILGTCGYWMDEKEQVIAEWRVPKTVNAVALYKGAPTIDPSLMINKEIFDTLGLYETKRIPYDYEFLARALRNNFRIENLQEYLICTMRRQDGQLYKRIRRSRAGVLCIKYRYLIYFFNFQTLFYTIKSLTGCLLPTFIIRKLADRWIMRNRI